MKQLKNTLNSVLVGLLVSIGFVNCTKKNDYKSTEQLQAQKHTLSTKSTGPFVHPGILNTKETLDFVRTEANTTGSDRSNWYTTTVIDFIQKNSRPTSFPSIVYVKSGGSTPTEAQIRKDCILAYAYALRWAKTGNSQFADSAKFILNGWASNFQKYQSEPGTITSQAYLEASWVAPSFAAAAEILKHYTVNGNTANWSSSSQSQFVTFLNILKNDYVNKVIGSGHQKNWAISAGYAKMAIGVYLDSRTVYDNGLQIIKDSIATVIESDGTMPELCVRMDCIHFQYSLTGLTYAAEMDRVQGTNEVFTNRLERLLKGYEFMESVFKDQNTCLPCSTARVYPGVELAHRYYGNATTGYLRGLRDPYGAPSDNTFLGFTTYTHRLVPE
jgi:hypothetical protein